MKNQVTVYNLQTYQILKVRVNRVITVASLREKIGAQFNVDPKHLSIKIGNSDKVFQSHSIMSSKERSTAEILEGKTKLFQDLNFSEEQLIGIEVHKNHPTPRKTNMNQSKLSQFHKKPLY